MEAVDSYPFFFHSHVSSSCKQFNKELKSFEIKKCSFFNNAPIKSLKSIGNRHTDFLGGIVKGLSLFRLITFV